MKERISLSFDEYNEKIKNFYEAFESECLKENPLLREVYTLELIFDRYDLESVNPSEYEKHYVFDSIKGKYGVYDFIKDFEDYLFRVAEDADVSYLVKKYILSNKTKDDFSTGNYKLVYSVLFDDCCKITDVKFPRDVEKVLEQYYQDLMGIYEEYISLSFADLFYGKAKAYSVRLDYSPGTRLKVRLKNGATMEYVVLCKEDENGIEHLVGLQVDIFNQTRVVYLSRLHDLFWEKPSFLIPLLKPAENLKNERLNKIADLLVHGEIEGEGLLFLYSEASKNDSDKIDRIFDAYLKQKQVEEYSYPTRVDLNGYKEFYDRAKSDFLSVFSKNSDNCIYVVNIMNDKSFENKYEIFSNFDKVKEYIAEILFHPIDENAYFLIKKKAKNENNDIVTIMDCIMQKDFLVTSFRVYEDFECNNALERVMAREAGNIEYNLSSEDSLPELVMIDDANSGDVYCLDIPNEGRVYVIYLGMVKNQFHSISRPLFLAKRTYADKHYYVDDLRGYMISAGLHNECRHLLKKACIEELNDDIFIRASKILAKDKDTIFAKEIVKKDRGISHGQDLIEQLILEYEIGEKNE